MSVRTTSGGSSSMSSKTSGSDAASRTWAIAEWVCSSAMTPSRKRALSSATTTRNDVTS